MPAESHMSNWTHTSEHTYYIDEQPKYKITKAQAKPDHQIIIKIFLLAKNFELQFSYIMDAVL